MGDKDKRVGWLRELVVGDEVAVWSSGIHSPTRIGRVEAITPSGMLDVRVGARVQRYSASGRCGSGFSGGWVDRPTPAVRERIAVEAGASRVRAAVRALSQVGRLEAIPIDVLTASAEAIEGVLRSLDAATKAAAK